MKRVEPFSLLKQRPRRSFAPSPSDDLLQIDNKSIVQASSLCAFKCAWFRSALTTYRKSELLGAYPRYSITALPIRRRKSMEEVSTTGQECGQYL